VQNTGSTNIQFAKITANLFNSADQLVDTDYTFTRLDVIAPGLKSCFRIIFLDEPAEWSRYELEGNYNTGGEIASGLVALNVSLQTNGSGTSEIIGQVRNDGSTRVNFVKPVGVLYDTSAKLLACDYTFVHSTDLDPGQTSSFKISFFSRREGAVDSYNLQVQGNPE
jgi:hypothetical protein